MFPLSKALSVSALLACLLAFVSSRSAMAATPDAKHWAYQPVRAVQPPADTSWSSHPIDRFIFAELQKRGLKPSPPADARTLVRRLYFDLLGLPPTPEQAAVFGEEIAVSLRVTRQPLVVFAEDVVGEQELRVAAAAGAERHEN